MRILGVDPGLTRCGVGIIDANADRSVSLVSVTVLTTDKDLELPQRLLQLRSELAALIEEFKPERIAVERVFAQHNLRTVMGTAQASAVAFVEAAERGIPVDMHTPSEVKASVTGTGRANKAQAIWVRASSNAGLPSKGDFSRLALRKVPITERLRTNNCAGDGDFNSG